AMQHACVRAAGQLARRRARGLRRPERGTHHPPPSVANARTPIRAPAGDRQMSSTEPTLDSLLQEDRTFPPAPAFTARANAQPGEHARAEADPEAYWAEWAGRLHWFRPWER